MPTLAVLTPTYNRRNTLERLYQSLLDSRDQVFVWIVVDDGSTDQTVAYLEDIVEKAPFPIVFLTQQNGGKASALRAGIARCEQELCFIVDSDDWLPPTSIERIKKVWEERKSESLAGIVALRDDGNGTPIGKAYLPDYPQRKLYELYLLDGFVGDTALIYRSEVLKKFPFPSFPDEKFVAEGYVWTEIDKVYDLLVCNEILYHCEYQPDGYTAHAKRTMATSPHGSMAYYNQQARLSEVLPGLVGIKMRLKYTVAYLVMCLIVQEPVLYKRASYPLLAVTLFPLAWAYRLFAKRTGHQI